MSFHMVYGADAILPPEVQLSSLRVEHFDSVDQDGARVLDVNLLDEAGDAALARVQKYQASVRKHYDKKVVRRSLEIADLVLKKDIPVGRAIDKHKFSSPWEGPYLVVEKIGTDAYVLAKINGALFPNKDTCSPGQILI